MNLQATERVFEIVGRVPRTDARWDLYGALPAGCRSLLDAGCGTGGGFADLRKNGIRVVGVDSDRDVVAEARQVLDDAVELDLEQANWPRPFYQSFDAVVFADCLEHLRDPWTVLRSVRSLLTPSGVVVASIPNLRQVRVLIKLLIGDWTYVAGPGIMANSHLRFFTRKTVQDMFHIAGYKDVRFYYPRDTFHLRRPERLLDTLTLRRVPDFFYNSLTVSAHP